MDDDLHLFGIDGVRPPRSTGSVADALETTSDDLLRYFRRRVPAEDAADLLTETLMTAWRRRRDAPDDAEGTRRWLFGIAHRTLLNHARGERRRLALADRLRRVLVSTDVVAPAADAHLHVRVALDRLPLDLAEVVRLIHWEGFTVTEVAAILGVGASTARDRYRRARDQLREWLAETETETKTATGTGTGSTAEDC